MAYFTAVVTFVVVSEITAAIVSSCKLFACTRDFRVVDLVGIETGGGMLIGLMGVTVGILIPNAGGTSGCNVRTCFSFMDTGISHTNVLPSVFCSVVALISSDC